MILGGCRCQQAIESAPTSDLLGKLGWLETTRRSPKFLQAEVSGHL